MLTQEQKRAICEEYKNPANKVTKIADRYGITRGQVAHIAVEGGAEPRNVRYGEKRTTDKAARRVCPKCHRNVDVKGAKFCCYCGSDIRSNRELLIERINKASLNIMLLPPDKRDEMLALFIAITEELKK